MPVVSSGVRFVTRAWVLGILTGLALAAVANSCLSQDQNAAPQAADAVQSLPSAFLRGPRAVSLAEQATLAMPQGFAFLPALETRAVLREWGNRPSDLTLGMVVPTKQGGAPPWFLVLAYYPEGYVKDDDAREWNRDALLNDVRGVLEASNLARRADGAPETRVMGWVVAPNYDSVAHRLNWSIAIAMQPGQNPEQSVNVNTVILGRSGYVSASLVMPLASYPRYAEEVENVVASITFDAGKRYADFNPRWDPVAERGLGNLVSANTPAKRSWLARIEGSQRDILYVLIAAALGVALGLIARGRKRQPA